MDKAIEQSMNGRIEQAANPVRAIVFDFGGVLIDWNPHYLYHKLIQGGPEAIDRFLAEIEFADWNAQQDKGRPFAEAVAEWSARYPHHAPLIRAYHERWDEMMGEPIQHTVELLRRLKDSGYPVYGLSNWSAETFPMVRTRHEFFGWFDLIVLSGAEKLIKPDPRIFALLLERIGRTAQECLFIDDSEKNILAAHQLGFHTVWFKSPEQLEAELRRLKLL